MNISEQTQAVLLLTAYFSKPVKGEPRPLSPTEWGRFALWLKEHDTPGALLRNDPGSLLSGWSDKTITLDRVRYLLARGSAMALALEKWLRAGLWVLTRSDADYPGLLKQHLKTDSPPVMFGCGNRNLLNKGAIAVVGSRNATDADLQFASSLGKDAAAQGYSIVSGGARGIDEAAMQGALAHEGTAIGVLADSLLRAVTSVKYRKALMANHLVLISPFNPEAGFDVGNAMSRNKYIYCLADAAVVVCSTKNKGGTWNGAVENLRHKWVPLWVKSSSESSSGNAELVRKGGSWLPGECFDLAVLVKASEQVYKKQMVYDEQKAQSVASAQISLPEDKEHPPMVSEPPSTDASGKQPDSYTQSPAAAIVPECGGFYDLFLRRFREVTTKAPLTVDEMLLYLDVCKTQLNDWLKRALEDGQAKKLSKPVRYQWQSQKPRQPSIFDDKKQVEY
ncbi:MAG: DNA-processing protein DprA [Syntrophobacteraceae bacterium]|jgi:predicted Rossmann fold nucleotide-binding protein DprA/Smf involved in DNA uptake